MLHFIYKIKQVSTLWPLINLIASQVVLDRTSIVQYALGGRMSTDTRLVTLLYLFLLFIGSGFSQPDYAQYVNPLIGSEGPIPGLAFGGG